MKQSKAAIPTTSTNVLHLTLLPTGIEILAKPPLAVCPDDSVAAD
jgi:hypothetical protein